jgi:hypothetical protein
MGCLHFLACTCRVHRAVRVLRRAGLADYHLRGLASWLRSLYGAARERMHGENPQEQRDTAGPVSGYETGYGWQARAVLAAAASADGFLVVVLPALEAF